jgi:hypothetical protein
MQRPWLTAVDPPPAAHERPRCPWPLSWSCACPQKELKVLCLNNYWLKFSDCAVYTTVGLQHILLRISHDLTQNIYAWPCLKNN